MLCAMNPLLCQAVPAWECLLVDVVLDAQQVIAHGLEGEFMEDGRDWVKASVQNQELRARFVRTLGRAERKRGPY